MDTGLHSGGAPFEYTVAQKKTPVLIAKKVSLLLGYGLWTLGLLAIGITVRLVAPLLAFIPISLWILVFLTWRFTQVQYEYSFFSGELTVSKIYGSRTRRKLVCLRIRNIDSAFPADADCDGRLARYQPQKTIFAASSQDSPSLYAILFTPEGGVKTVLWIDGNEKAVKIMRYYNIAVEKFGNPCP